jgi:hypothetical protein
MLSKDNASAKIKKMKYDNYRLPSETETVVFNNVKHHIITSFSTDFKKIKRIKIIPSNKFGTAIRDIAEDQSNYLTSRISRSKNLKATLEDLWDECPRRSEDKPSTIIGFIVKRLLKKIS